MQEQYSNDEQTQKLNDKDQVKRILLKNYKAKRSEEKTWTFMAEKLDEQKAAYLRIANAQSLKGTILRAAKFRLWIHACNAGEIGGTRVILRKSEEALEYFSALASF